MDIKGKVVAITGSGRGLGQAMAHHLARKGATLALIDNNEKDLPKAAKWWRPPAPGGGLSV
ncbi:SDR family NAD(P)-dependent oxidoreductase [Oceanisphaera psychrotolerans]|uniref:SDR family NAD(P)-dependent oxidoreductase n=1 Tax=Oceanisphaera psychrotolerans TaxID=1414654 RepID=UPI002481C3BE|nr:SDR family NAD(P)-dependent oxidoreductase [Oceanisphaera psychrotolerans]